MTPFVDFDVSAVELLSRTHRDNEFVAWIKSLFSQIKRNHYIFGLFRFGSNAPSWFNLTAYSIGFEVFYKRKIYRAIRANAGSPPDVSPLDWELILDNFIGVEERNKYSYQKIVLEYALNRYFKTTFRQPPLISDIYITNQVIVYNSFVVFEDDNKSSKVFEDKSSAFVYEIENYSTTPTSYQFIVNIPTGVFSALGIASIAESIIRKFLDVYIPAGIYYKIVTY